MLLYPWKKNETIFKTAFNKFSALILFYPPTASSHDGWVEIFPTIVEKGQPATVALIQGNHSNEHRSYRIAGKWDAKYTTLIVIDPKGKQNTLTNRLVDLGEDDDKVGPKVLRVSF